MFPFAVRVATTASSAVPEAPVAAVARNPDQAIKVTPLKAEESREPLRDSGHHSYIWLRVSTCLVQTPATLLNLQYLLLIQVITVLLRQPSKKKKRRLTKFTKEDFYNETLQYQEQQHKAIMKNEKGRLRI